MNKNGKRTRQILATAGATSMIDLARSKVLAFSRHILPLLAFSGFEVVMAGGAVVGAVSGAGGATTVVVAAASFFSAASST